MSKTKYATGGVVKPTRFICPFCGNVAWQAPIFPNKPLCEDCGVYMDDEMDNPSKESKKCVKE